MRQQVIYSALIMAVAPVAAMADTGVYQNITTVFSLQASAPSTQTLLETTEVTKVQDYKIAVTASAAATVSIKLTVGTTAQEHNENLSQGVNYISIPSTGNQTIKLEATGTTADVKLSKIALIKKDLKYNSSDELQEATAGTNSLKASLAEFKAKVDQYALGITQANYTVKDANNRDLTLLQDICNGKENEFTVANFERFDLYNGIADIEAFFNELVGKIEVDQADKEIADTKVPDGAEGVNQETKDAIAAIPALKEAYEQAKTNVENAGGAVTEAQIAALKAAKDNLVAAQQYANFFLTIDEVDAQITIYGDLLDEYEATLGNEVAFQKDAETVYAFDEDGNRQYEEGKTGAALGEYQINAFRTSATRLAGIKAVRDEFVKLAKEGYTTGAITFNAPENVQTTVLVDGSSKSTKKYKDVATLLGKKSDVKRTSSSIGVKENIGYVKYCAQQYQARFDQVIKAIDEATAQYATVLHYVELAINEAEQKERTADYTLLRNYLKEQLDGVAMNEGQNGIPGLETLEATITAAKQTGDIISYETNKKPASSPSSQSGWGIPSEEFNSYVWTAALESDYVPADLWLHQAQAIVAEFQAKANDIKEYVAKVRKQFDADYAEVTGTENADLASVDADDQPNFQLQGGLNTATDGIDESVKDLFTDAIKDIQQEIDDLYKEGDGDGANDEGTVEDANENIVEVEGPTTYTVTANGTFAVGETWILQRQMSDGTEWNDIINPLRINDELAASGSFIAPISGNFYDEDASYRFVKLDGNNQPIAETAIALIPEAETETSTEAEILTDEYRNGNGLGENEEGYKPGYNATVAKIREEILALAAAAANASNDYAAWKAVSDAVNGTEKDATDDTKIVAVEGSLQDRYDKVKAIIDALTPATGEGAITDPTYTGTQFLKVEYKQYIENYIANVKSQIDDAYGLGTADEGKKVIDGNIATFPDNAQDYKDGHNTTVVGTQATDDLAAWGTGNAQGKEIVNGAVKVTNGGFRSGSFVDMTAGTTYNVYFNIANLTAGDGTSKVGVKLQSSANADLNAFQYFDNGTGSFSYTPDVDQTGVKLIVYIKDVSADSKVNSFEISNIYVTEGAEDTWKEYDIVVADGVTVPTNTLKGWTYGDYDDDRQMSAEPTVEGNSLVFAKYTAASYELGKLTGGKEYTLSFIASGIDGNLNWILLDADGNTILDANGKNIVATRFGGVISADGKNTVQFTLADDAEVEGAKIRFMSRSTGFTLSNVSFGVTKTYADIDQYLKNLENEADYAQKAINHYKEVRAAVDALNKRIVAIETSVENHGVYTDFDEKCGADYTDYKTQIENWRASLEDITKAIKDASTVDNGISLYDEAHWDVLNALVAPTISDLADEEKVQADKDLYEFEARNIRLAQLRDQIYGTDGDYEQTDPAQPKAKADGLVDTALSKFTAAKKTFVDALNKIAKALQKEDPSLTDELARQAAGVQYFGSEENYSRLMAAMGALEQRIRSTANANGNTVTSDDREGAWELWNQYLEDLTVAASQEEKNQFQQKLNDELQLLKDILDAALDEDLSNEKVNEIVLNPSTNIKRLADYAAMVAKYAASFAELNDLYKRVNNGLNETYDDELQLNEVNAALTEMLNEDVYGTNKGRHTFDAKLKSYLGAEDLLDIYTNEPVDPYVAQKYTYTFNEDGTVDKTPVDGETIPANLVALRPDVDKFVYTVPDFVANPELVDDLKENLYDEDLYKSTKGRLNDLGIFDPENIGPDNGLISKAVYDAMLNHTAYKAMVAAKERLSTRIQNVLDEIDNAYEETAAGNTLKDLITTAYKPVPGNMTDFIETDYEQGVADSQYTPDALADVDAGKTWADGIDPVYDEDSEQLHYHVLKLTLKNLNDLYYNFQNGGYEDAVTAENADAIQAVKDAYDEVYQLYSDAVQNLNAFKGSELKDEKLKAAYADEFDKLTLLLYKTPNALTDALYNARMAEDEATGEVKHYDNTADLALIEKIKNEDVTGPWANFVANVKNAVAERWAELENATNGYTEQITGVQDAIADYYAIVAKPRVKFSTYYSQNGAAPYFNMETGKIDGQYDYLWQIKGKVADAQKLADGIAKTDWKAYGDVQKFDELISGELLDVEQEIDEETGDWNEAVYTATTEHLNDMHQEAAYTDLTVRIQEMKEEHVTPDAQTILGSVIDRTVEIKATNEETGEEEVVKTVTVKEGEQQQIPTFDENGNPIVDEEGNPVLEDVDLTKPYNLEQLGVDALIGYPKADADHTDDRGNVWSYNEALRQADMLDAVLAEFEGIVAESIGEAEDLTESAYNDEEQLLQDSRADVMELYRKYYYKVRDVDAFKTNILPQLEEAYKQLLANSNYLYALQNFDDLLETAEPGILSLYVGADYVDELEALKQRRASIKLALYATPDEAEEAAKDLVDDLKKLAADAKADDYRQMMAEITTLKDEYNQMMSDAQEAIKKKIAEEGTDADVTAEEAVRDELQQTFDNDDVEKRTDEQGWLNIDENIENLQALFDDNDTPEDITDDVALDETDYPDLVDLEHNISLIKTEIANQLAKRGLLEQAPDVAADAAELLGDAQALLDQQSQWALGTNGKMVLLSPENNVADGYLFSDFGLYQNYLKSHFSYVEDEAAGLKANVDAIYASIVAKTNTTEKGNVIYLYENKIKQQLARFQQEGANDLTQLDVTNNENVENDVETMFETNQALLAKAADHQVQYERVMKDYNNIVDKLTLAKETVTNLGEDAPAADWTEIEAELAKIKTRIMVYYLHADNEPHKAFDENINLNDYKPGSTYDLFKYYYNGEEITEEWLAEKGLTEVYIGNGKVKLPATEGLNWVDTQITEAIQGVVDQMVEAKLEEGREAFREALNLLNNTLMRKADKAVLKKELYGNSPYKFFDGGYEEELAKFHEAYRDGKITSENFNEFLNSINALISKLKGDFAEKVAANLVGDLDNNGKVNVIDLSYLIDVVRTPAEMAKLSAEEFGRYDLNNDGYIDIVDLGIMVDLMVGNTWYLTHDHSVDGDFEEAVLESRTKSSEKLMAQTVATEGTTQRIAISLQNVREYTAFQMDVTLPKGMKLVGQQLSNRAGGQELYADGSEGTVRILAFTAGMDAFQGNDGDLLYLDVTTDETYNGGAVSYDNIIFLTTNSKGVHFQMNGETTGIISRMAEAIDAAKEKVYNLGGRVMDGLKKGVNIIRGEKVIKK